MKNIARFFASLFIVLAMAFVAEITNNNEVIFPEAFALVVGGLFCTKQIWNVDKPRFLILMSISAFVGYSLSAFTELYMPLKITVAMIFSVVLLAFSKSSLYPVISACVLPILMNTNSVFYPISVIAITAIVIAFQCVFEKSNIIEKNKFIAQKMDAKNDLPKWCVIIISVFILGAIGLKIGAKFLIAPPLIVGFTELVFGAKKDTKGIAKIYVFNVFASVIGGILTFVLSTKTNARVTIITAITAIIMLFVGKAFKVYFPPAYAISILPTILNKDMLIFYPAYVTVGFLVFVLVAYYTRKINLKSKR